MESTHPARLPSDAAGLAPPATAPSSRRRSWPSLVGDAIDACAGAAYRSLHYRAADLVLKRLGVATPRRRADFATLARIVRTIPFVPGAVLECGTHHGATLLGMAHLLRNRGFSARIYGLDSFEGFPDPTSEDALDDGTLHPSVHRGALNEPSLHELTRRIRRMDLTEQVTVIKGFFDDTLQAVASERFSVVHLDCDLYDSYMSCLKFVYPRMLAGGYIVFDDYKSPVYPGAQRAVDEFFARRREQIQYFPDIEGRRYFTYMGGGLAPGARAEPKTAERPGQRRVA